MARPSRPAMQGDLDGLCGVYSIVNAVQWALHTCTTDRLGIRASPQALDLEPNRRRCSIRS